MGHLRISTLAINYALINKKPAEVSQGGLLRDPTA